MGSQTPRIRIMPEYGKTLGSFAAEFMEEHDMALDEWQANIMDDWLALDDCGKYAAKTCGLSAPRQNGKTYVLKARCYAGISARNETILYTAHEVKTARKTFEQMAADFDPDTGYPDLAANVEYIRRANGQEEIKLKDWQDDDGNWHDGGCIIFSARSRGAARGFTADVFIADEAQELTSEQLAALMPTISAGRLKNPQTIMIGTPPAPGCVGDVFKSTRDKALGDNPGRIAWHEWSVTEIGDVTDWARVENTNPSLDAHLMRSAVESEMAAMAPDYFARERLGWWSEQSAKAVIPVAKWKTCATQSPPIDGLLAYAVKFTPDGSTGTLSVCLRPTDGHPHVEVIESRSMSRGLAWFADWLESRADGAAAIVIDGMSNAQPLVDELLRRGVRKRKIKKPRSGDVSAACSMLLNAVNEGTLTHYDQDALNDSATGCSRRSIGSGGGWGFDGAGSSLIESCALALWGAMSTKRNPSKKAKVAF